MSTDEKLEQSSIVKERGTQYFKVSYSSQLIIAFLGPCHELIMIFTASVISEWCSLYSMRFCRESWRGMCLKRNLVGLSKELTGGSCLLELFALSTHNTVGCTVFQFLLWDSGMSEQHSFG